MLNCFGRVLKRSFSAHSMRIKLFLVTFYLNGGLHAVSMENSLNGCQIFGRFSF